MYYRKSTKIIIYSSKIYRKNIIQLMIVKFFYSNLYPPINKIVRLSVCIITLLIIYFNIIYLLVADNLCRIYSQNLKPAQ